MSEHDARSYSRRYLTDKQVEEWSACIKQKTLGGFVLLTPRDIAEAGFVLKVEWVPSRGRGSAPLVLELDGGQINGKQKVVQPFEGPESRSFIVKPAKDSKRVTVIANIAAADDSISVLLEQPKPQPAPVNIVQRVVLCTIGLPEDCVQPLGRTIVAGCPSKEEGERADSSGKTHMPPGGWVTFIPVEEKPVTR